MKKVILVLVLGLFGMGGLFGQDCLPEGIVFTSQSQIDSFAINYPGCTNLLGDLEIVESISGDIVNLQPLSQLTELGENLHIHNNDSLVYLSGLENITMIGHGLNVSANYSLINLTGLDNIITVGSGSGIGSNHSLESLTGLESLVSVGGIFIIVNNGFIEDCSGLNNLTYVGGNFEIKGHDELISLSGLENFTSGYSLLIENNDRLKDLSGLNNLNNLENSLRISDNDSLINFSGLENLEDINHLDIYQNNSLIDLTALQSLNDTIPSISIYNNTALTNLIGLENITTISQTLRVVNSLENLNGLNNLTTIGWNLDLVGDVNLVGLENLQSIGINPFFNNGLTIQFNDSIQTLSDLQNLNKIEGSIIIDNNDSLKNLNQFENINISNTPFIAINNNYSLAVCTSENLCLYLLNGGDATITYNAAGCFSVDEVMTSCIQLTDHTKIVGQVLGDSDQNCEENINNTILPNWQVNASNNVHSITVTTDSLGYYNLLVLEGDWTINAISPYNFWTSCFTDSIVNASAMNDTIGIDFYMHPEADCPYIEWDLSMPPLRICNDNTVVINYCNYGTLPAEDVEMTFILDNFLTIQSATIPYTENPDGTITFEIGTVDIFECEQINIEVFVDCDDVELNDLQCIDVTFMPDDLCSPDPASWDGSTVTVEGFCEGDSIFFELHNIGVGAMSQEAQFRVDIVIDEIILLHDVDNYQLNPGEQLIRSYNIADMGDGLRLEADQTPGHPVVTEASVNVPNCEDIVNNQILNFLSANNGNPFAETFCLPIVGSFDPNDKNATPIGLGDNHEIEKDWELDYTIRFQNTGNAEAYIVVIKDTLSENLDLNTFKARGASHDFTWAINLDRELVFTFADINLPDSTSNEPESHGFVSYSILPNADIIPLEIIENRAGIYFDSNDPIITNTVFHTIRKPVVGSSEHLTWCIGDAYGGQIITQDTSIQILTSFVEYDSIHFIHLDAVVCSNVNQQDFSEIKIYPNPTNDLLHISNHQNGTDQQWSLVNTIGKIVWNKDLGSNENLENISLKSLPAGIYLLEVKTELGTAVWRILKK